MRLKIFSKRIIAPSALLGVLFVVVIMGYASHTAMIQDLQTRIGGENSTVPAEGTNELAVPGSPLRLKIPKINIDAEVEYVSLTQEGEMDVPKDTNNVGWYEQGVRPGENGNAVIAGHYGWRDGEASAFDELHKLRIGDRIYVKDDTGAIITFIVRKNRRYEPNDDASEVFNATDEGSHLNLITCEGEWDGISQSYSKRLVVFADKE